MEQVYKRRLIRLANHMLSFTAEQNAKHFRMRTFLEHRAEELTPLQALLQHVLSDCYCETVACAVGHAPALFPELMKKFDKECSIKDVDFSHYDEETQEPVYKEVIIPPGYPELSKYLFNINVHTSVFNFLFGGDWDTGRLHEYGSTSWAVADRIFYYLDHPETYNESYYGWRYYSARKGKASEAVLGKMMEELESLENQGAAREYAL